MKGAVSQRVGIRWATSIMDLRRCPLALRKCGKMYLPNIKGPKKSKVGRVSDKRILRTAWKPHEPKWSGKEANEKERGKRKNGEDWKGKR